MCELQKHLCGLVLPLFKFQQDIDGTLHTVGTGYEAKSVGGYIGILNIDVGGVYRYTYYRCKGGI